MTSAHRGRFVVALLCVLAALPLAPHSLVAQSASACDSACQRDGVTAQWRVGFFIGGAHDSPTGFLGVTPGRDHRFLGFDAQTTMLRLGGLRVNYGVQLLPVVILSGRAVIPGYHGEEQFELPGPDRAYAWGLSPFGFELATPSEQRVSVFTAAAAGGLVFNTPFPIPEGQRLNFTLEYGGGAMVRVGNAHWIRVGYKYHHLSNAYTARLNPGVDGNVFYGGYQWAVRLPR